MYVCVCVVHMGACVCFYMHMVCIFGYVEVHVWGAVVAVSLWVLGMELWSCTCLAGFLPTESSPQVTCTTSFPCPGTVSPKSGDHRQGVCFWTAQLWQPRVWECGCPAVLFQPASVFSVSAVSTESGISLLISTKENQALLGLLT